MYGYSCKVCKYSYLNLILVWHQYAFFPSWCSLNIMHLHSITCHQLFALPSKFKEYKEYSHNMPCSHTFKQYTPQLLPSCARCTRLWSCTIWYLVRVIRSFPSKASFLIMKYFLLKINTCNYCANNHDTHNSICCKS